MGSFCKDAIKYLGMMDVFTILIVGNDFMDVCIFQALFNYVLKMCSLLFQSYFNQPENDCKFLISKCHKVLEGAIHLKY